MNTGQIHTIKLWLKAFIPRDIEGCIDVPAGSPHAGKTMLATPGLNVCFLTDQRDFSEDISAHSRMHSEIEIDLTQGVIMRQHHHCDPTIEINSETGEEGCNESASTDDMEFTALTQIHDNFILELHASTKNPCLKIANIRISPNLDYIATIGIQLVDDRRKARISFDGMIEVYPAFEMYFTLNNGAPITLFRAPVMPNTSPTDLIGAPTRPVKVTVEATI